MLINIQKNLFVPCSGVKDDNDDDRFRQRLGEVVIRK